MRRTSYRNSILVFLLLWVGIISHANANIIRDTELEYRLQALSLPLARQAGFGGGVRFRVVVDPSYNAFVVGQDIIYVHSGLLLDAQSDGEILGVIAHEIGHLASGHVPRRDEAISQANLATALTALAAIVSTVGGSGDATAGIIIAGTDRAQRNYLAGSRRDEAVADEWALAAMENTGVSALGLRQLMRRLASQRALPESRQSQYYTSHPGPANRLSSIEDHVSNSTVSDVPIPESVSRHLWRIRAKLSGYTNLELTSSLQHQINEATPEKLQDITLAIAYKDAIRAYRRGALTDATQAIDSLLADYPDDPFFHELAGDIAFATGDLLHSAEEYRRALEIFPDAPQIALSLGRVLVATGDSVALDEAVQMLERAAQGEPKWAFARRELGIAYGRNNQLANAHLSLAEAAMLIEDKQQAINEAERALRAKPLPDDVMVRAEDILFQLSAPNR